MDWGLMVSIPAEKLESGFLLGMEFESPVNKGHFQLRIALLNGFIEGNKTRQ
jgi:hypothetical protein